MVVTPTMVENELVSIPPKSLIYYVSSGVVVEKHIFSKKTNEFLFQVVILMFGGAIKRYQ